MKTARRFETQPLYQPGEPFEALAARLGCSPADLLKLDANENPYGLSPRARQALADLPFAHYYGNPDGYALREALAGYTGVPAEHILLGSGADELTDLVLRVMLEAGEKVLICPPAFEMYAFDTQLNGGQVVAVGRKPDFSLDLEGIRLAVARQKPKVIFLTNPNNPDGGLMTPAEIEAILALPALVVLDEAYIEFVDDGGRLGEGLSWMRQAPQRLNLAVIRTFSKWAGLAGLRIGYGAFPAWLLPTLWKARQPYSINVAAEAAALASLDDLDWLAENVARMRVERVRLLERLRQIPYLEPIPSQANFILCRVKGRKAAEVKERLAAQGILIRLFDNEALANALRITVGRPEDTDRVSRALLALVGDSEAERRIAADWSVAAPQAIELAGARVAQVRRSTRETRVEVRLALDGSGRHHIHTGLGFFDHMLAQIAVHGLFDLDINVQGDLEVDPHHSIEDTALALGEAFAQALGERKGIVRMSAALVPMDESLAEVVVDLSGRPYAVVQAAWQGPETGGIPNSLWAHFCASFAQRCGCNLHVTLRNGGDDHHQVEAIFKGLGRALAAATRIDPRRSGQVASSKGTLSV